MKEEILKSKELLERIKTGLWQISLGTHGFEEATPFSTYAVQKAKDLLSLLNSSTALQECDTTTLNQGSEPPAQNNTPVKEDWISVEDGLPPLDQTVILGWEGKDIAFGCRRGEDVYIDPADNWKWVFPPTHWQPLPPPPTNPINKPLK